MSHHTRTYGRVCLTGSSSALPRVLFVHTGARSARPDNQGVLLDLLGDLSARFHGREISSQSDLVQDTCDLAAALEESGLVSAGQGDENHVCLGLCDIRAGTTQYAALLATSARTPSRAIPPLMKDQDVSPVLAGPEADKYCQALGFTTEYVPTTGFPRTVSDSSTDTIGLITFDPAAGLLLGLTSSTRPGTANRGRIPPSCLPCVGLKIHSDNYHLCGLCTGFTDSLLLGYASVEDMLRRLPLSETFQSSVSLSPLPAINPHVDFFSLAVGSSPGARFPPQLFTSCALGGEAFIYSWGPTVDTTILSMVP
ncbi:Hypothetical protein GLP15_2943 [Giardia lamblia P15]|uniref:Uncharacterized protein n=1 Tax=Giardia intestinalis (strain P15) TaxID=658858 RepID=E1F921_GIAIA|nr:Hypothetical protein GLP15_2943 [Giardia lamblia P15]